MHDTSHVGVNRQATSRASEIKHMSVSTEMFFRSSIHTWSRVE